MNFRDYERDWYNGLSFWQKVRYKLICLAGNINYLYWRIRKFLGLPYNPHSIFVVVTLENLENETPTRSPGFYHKLGQARRAVKQNACDIWETCYDYAAVVEVEPGMYGDQIIRFFFKFDTTVMKYRLIKIPKGIYLECGLG